jgi:hypothetical protein
MNIDEDGNMELTDEENQDLMDRLDIPPSEYDDPPVDIEYLGVEQGVASFRATHSRTGKSIVMVFDAEDPGP